MPYRILAVDCTLGTSLSTCGLGTGGTALVSRVLGEGDKERANKYFSMITLFGILLGVILTVVGVLTMRPMAILLGATEAMVDDCVLYGRIVVCFLTSFMLQNMFQSFLIAAERPKFGLLITLAAGVTNMVLDALFVGVFRWGIAGAAIATGISQTVGGVVPLMYFLFSKSSPCACAGRSSKCSRCCDRAPTAHQS